MRGCEIRTHAAANQMTKAKVVSPHLFGLTGPLHHPVPCLGVGTILISSGHLELRLQRKLTTHHQRLQSLTLGRVVNLGKQLGVETGKSGERP